MSRRKKRHRASASCLLLNASYEPLRVIPLSRAVTLALQGKADILEEDDAKMIRSELLQLGSPVVARLRYMVSVPYRREAPVSRAGVLARDRHVCAYCGDRATTVDHVIPRSRGGENVWLNVLAACEACNSKKDDKFLKELGWNPRFHPRVPTREEMVMGHYKVRPEAWLRWVPSLAS